MTTDHPTTAPARHHDRAGAPAPRLNGWCRDEGLHLWCPGTTGRYGRQPCACPCHGPNPAGTSLATETTKGQKR